MAQPKRKSPDRKPAKKKGPSVATRTLQSTVAAITRYPRLLSGIAIFSVVFSFVAANALWYQPKHHPAPLLATRMFENDGRSKVKRAQETADDAGVTTFRIERESETALQHVPADPQKPVASPLIKQIQQSLADRGLYDGPADGLTGPKTTSAILFFQETEGLDQTGEPSTALLAKIKSRTTDVAVIPDERPSMDVTASTKTSDDVADLIRAADVKPVPRATPIKADSGDKTTEPVPVETVMKIQKALSKFAYANIKVDGVAGAATRAAIRSFEKNYNLPVTGEPSERVLKKLKAIGAL
jgi:peptidoglycan hydrolase-like protein with peptidoglycan-binding domain